MQQLATLGGGCFWCLEAVFEQVRGVLRVESGYCGGTTPNPTYRQVCQGDTHHAEVVQITFDPTVVTYRQLLEVFFGTHDPTTLNRQGADVGTQYRSVIFPHDQDQEQTARQVIAELTSAGLFERPIVTTIEPLSTFYRAEDYHQGYYQAHPAEGYCQIVISPKLSKFRKQYAHLLR